MRRQPRKHEAAKFKVRFGNEKVRNCIGKRDTEESYVARRK
jgi:hypothetical protein